MADHTHIEWTDATWNPITGCAIVSPGCTNCYAMKLAGTRLKHIPSRAGLTTDGKSGPVWNGKVRLNEEWLDQPLRWKRPRRIFVCAHGDLFAENVPDEWIDRVFAVMALAPQHTFQVLTKRASRMREYMSDAGIARRVYDMVCDMVIVDQVPAVLLAEGIDDPGLMPSWPRVTLDTWPLPNVWLGVSAERQQEAAERVPELLATPAAIRFVSAEPLLGPIDFRKYMWPVHPRWPGAYANPADALASGAEVTYHRQALVGAHCVFLDWIIVGGESGNGSRPMHPAWARQIRDDCKAAGVPFFFKQWGAWWPQECNPLPDQRFAERLRIAGIKPSRTRPERGCWGADGLWHPGKIAGAPPAYTSWNIGKKAAGRLLDGVEHNGMPIPAAGASER